VIANDIMGLGALRFFYERHISVPDDVSVLSFDDSFLCSYASPALTAVDLNRELSGRLAADMMLRMVSEESHGEKTVISVPLGIVPRESVKDRRTVR
jgi:DNA-binding LacI/PurR family transcriptional regulator